MKGPEFVIVYGPLESGKTLNAEALRKHFDCDMIIDAEALRSYMLEIRTLAPKRVLLLSHTAQVEDPFAPKSRRRVYLAGEVVSIEAAKHLLGDKWISPVRGYHLSNPPLVRLVPKTGCGLIESERKRGITEEGFTQEHDKTHDRGELIDAALSYIRAGINVGHPAMQHPPMEWPFEREWWKPSDDRIRNYVKAGALIAAEIDRLIQIRIKGFAPANYVIKAMPEIVCLCGSTRFWKQFQKSSLELTMAGKIVLSIGAASGTDDEHFGNLPREEYDAIKQGLDELHKRKIDLADSVLILNVDGYIGESTRSELEYARSKGKRVAFLEPIGGVR